MQLFEVVQLPFCKVLMTERWNEPAHRYFIAYRARGDFRSVLGLPVIDEFATFSSPIFFAPSPMLGKIYNAGISLGHLRDREMSIDTGWPPLCIGTSGPATELPALWDAQLMRHIQAFTSPSGATAHRVDEYLLQHQDIDGIAVYATNAPLLPKQLARICDLGDSSFTLSFSTANRIVRQQEASPMTIEAVSEATLRKILQAFQA